MAETYRARTSFSVAGYRVIKEGDIVTAGDPVRKGRDALFQPMSEYIEQTTAVPGEVLPATIPDPPRTGTRNAQGEAMPHALPPEHEDSPASPFAPGQPAAGIVADDTPPEQNPGGGTKAADAPTIENTPPEPQTPLQEANAEASAKAKKSAK